MASNSNNNANSTNNPTFKYYEKVRIENDIIGLFLGKEKKNLNHLKSISNNVIVSFVSLRDKDFSLVIIKSNIEQQYSYVYRQLKLYINNANQKLLAIKEQKKGIKIIKQKQRENKIKKEIAERIEKEISQKKIELLKQECNNNDSVNDEDDTNIYISNNPYFKLDVNYE